MPRRPFRYIPRAFCSEMVSFPRRGTLSSMAHLLRGWRSRFDNPPYTLRSAVDPAAKPDAGIKVQPAFNIAVPSKPSCRSSHKRRRLCTTSGISRRIASIGGANVDPVVRRGASPRVV